MTKTAREITMQDLMDVLQQSFTNVQEQLDDIKTTMITKEYLEEKLAESQGDTAVMVKKEDVKLNTLISILGDRQVLTKADQRRLAYFEPLAG